MDTCACGPDKGQTDHRKKRDSVQGPVRSRLFKTGFLVTMGIGIHNLPEGMATFVGTMQNPKLGLIIAIAIALHNIPEGIAMSVPVWVATGSRKKALFWSAVSGAAEPLGALLAALVLLPFLTHVLLGVILAAVAGIMIYIALDELVPVGCSFQHENLSILGVIAGMAVMALSLGMLR
jgi:ZIP family zinc transporter